VVLIAVFGIFGCWILAWTSWLWARPRRLRVGENGFAIMPSGQSVAWSRVGTVELRVVDPGWRLKVVEKASSAADQSKRTAKTLSWRLPPLQAPGNWGWRAGLRLFAVQSLMTRQLDAFNVRHLMAEAQEPEEVNSDPPPKTR